MCFVEPVGVRWNTRVLHQGAVLHRSPPIQLFHAPDRKQLLMRCESLLMIIGRHGARDNSTVRKMRPEEGRGVQIFHPAVVQLWYEYHTKVTAGKQWHNCRPDCCYYNCGLQLSYKEQKYNGLKRPHFMTHKPAMCTSISLTRLCICKLTGALGTLG